MKSHLFQPMIRMTFLLVVQLLTLAAVVLLVTRAPLITQFTTFVEQIGTLSFLLTMLHTLGHLLQQLGSRRMGPLSYPYLVSVNLYKYMGGVDVANTMHSVQLLQESKHKWYMRLFWFLVGISFINAHFLNVRAPTIGQPNHQVPGRTYLTEANGQKPVESHSSQKNVALQPYHLVKTIIPSMSLVSMTSHRTARSAVLKHHTSCYVMGMKNVGFTVRCTVRKYSLFNIKIDTVSQFPQIITFSKNPFQQF